MVEFTTGRGGHCRSGRALFALVLSLLGAGCYGYTPVSPAAATPGSSVRLRVVAHSTLRADPAPVPGAAQVIRGKLLPANSPDTLLCAVSLRSDDPRMPALGLRSVVPVAVADVERLEVRHLQKGRTAATIAAAALVGVLVLDWALDVNLPNEGAGEPGGVNNSRRRLFQLSW